MISQGLSDPRTLTGKGNGPSTLTPGAEPATAKSEVSGYVRVRVLVLQESPRSSWQLVEILIQLGFSNLNCDDLDESRADLTGTINDMFEWRSLRLVKPTILAISFRTDARPGLASRNR